MVAYVRDRKGNLHTLAKRHLWGHTFYYLDDKLIEFRDSGIYVFKSIGNEKRITDKVLVKEINKATFKLAGLL